MTPFDVLAVDWLTRVFASLLAWLAVKITHAHKSSRSFSQTWSWNSAHDMAFYKVQCARPLLTNALLRQLMNVSSRDQACKHYSGTTRGEHRVNPAEARTSPYTSSADASVNLKHQSEQVSKKKKKLIVCVFYLFMYFIKFYFSTVTNLPMLL